ncbi:MAG: dTDP-glucose 4,6-dehydratase [Hyphomonadaceae bacterium]
MQRVLVTGGAGFIGSALVRRLVVDGHAVLNVDKLTYAGDLRTVAACEGRPNYAFAEADISDADAMRDAFAEFQPTRVIHLAAESHVDRSIDGPGAFIDTNIVGTYVLLDAALAYWRALGEADENFHFLHVSTDEVYGSLGEAGAFHEETPYAPNSPYSASKAAADHLARAWRHTYGLPVLISNCSNNYGPYQHPEKLIPTVLRNALAGNPIPIYGAGANVRDWLYVDDHVDALLTIVERGRLGEKYNVGGSSESSNLALAERLCALLDELRPRHDGQSYAKQITMVRDRPGHDFRYAIDASKLARELGWRPSETLETGLRKTVRWFLENADWLASKRDEGRLGLGSAT